MTERGGWSTPNYLLEYDRHYLDTRYEIGPMAGVSARYKHIGLDLRYAQTYQMGKKLTGKAPNSRYLGLSVVYHWN